MKSLAERRKERAARAAYLENAEEKGNDEATAEVEASTDKSADKGGKGGKPAGWK